jgi:streptogramin lyase
MKWSVGLGLLLCGLVIASGLYRIDAQPRSTAMAAQPQAGNVSVGADNIGGVVTSSKGPEAGVWVIAETTNLPTKFRKIVVTDDQGRYLLPELPNVNYKVWVRGYGLVDSKPVEAKPGKALALTAIVAPTAQAAAQYYPADYWFSMLNIPRRSDFPDAHSQAEFLTDLKRGCNVCHQTGNKATRDLEPALGTFKSPRDAWERRLMSGQVGPQMTGALNRMGHDRGLNMFADWTTRINAGEVPPMPPRPQGVERNVVVTLWETGTDKSFIHDVIASNERNVTVNAYGPVYSMEFAAAQIWAIDPRENTKTKLADVPLRNPADRKLFKTFSPQTVAAPSPYWGNDIVWDDPNFIAMPHMDSKGRIWFHAQTIPQMAPYCRKGSGNPFAEYFPIPEGNVPRGMAVYDPKTGKIELIDLCLSAGHMAFSDDKDETLYFTDTGAIPPRMGGLGWVKTKVWDATHDPQKSIGWCPAVIDYNGDGKNGPYTTPDEPIDPKLDRAVDGGNGYGFAFNPVDKSLWYAGLSSTVPGRIIRMVAGDNPPATCKTEVYEPPFDNPKRPGVEAFQTLGIAVDTNGLVWAGLAGSNDLASFDRSKCTAPSNGPNAMGQQCPEGWTLYRVPGPKFKGTDILADAWYHNWMDKYDALGLGKNVSIICSDGDDSLIVYLPDQKKFVTMRVPYPLDFYTRNVDFRIDDPNAGWKGRGLWTGNEDRVIWHLEGGKGNTTSVAHFQIRPDPLAK